MLLFSWFSGFGLGSLLLGIACSTAVSIRMGKRTLFIASMLLTGIFTAALYVIPPHATITIIASEILRQFSYGLSGPILWAMMGDVADWGEWKTGRRATGTVTGGVVFALWAGLALAIVWMTDSRSWQIGVVIAFSFAVLLASGLIFPNPYMPVQVRQAHFLELASSMFAYGIIAGWVWTRPVGTRPVLQHQVT